MKLHEKVREIRLEKGIRQNFVAKKLGLRVSTYNSIEMGHRPLRADLLKGLASVLEVDPSIFLNTISTKRVILTIVHESITIEMQNTIGARTNEETPITKVPPKGFQPGVNPW